jgi:hypothetical protein
MMGGVSGFFGTFLGFGVGGVAGGGLEGMGFLFWGGLWIFVRKVYNVLVKIIV